MSYVGLNTVCPACGMAVPESMPPMEVSYMGHLDDRRTPMLRVCCQECARLVLQEPDFYYRAAKANIQADRGKSP